MTGLARAISFYCPHCGRGDEVAIDYIIKHDKDQKALYKEACEMPDGYKESLMGFLPCSDYDIFTPWYKAFLIYCVENNIRYCDDRAAEQLQYYKKSFDKVEDLK